MWCHCDGKTWLPAQNLAMTEDCYGFSEKEFSWLEHVVKDVMEPTPYPPRSCSLGERRKYGAMVVELWNAGRIRKANVVQEVAVSALAWGQGKHGFGVAGADGIAYLLGRSFRDPGTLQHFAMHETVHVFNNEQRLGLSPDAIHSIAERCHNSAPGTP